MSATIFCEKNRNVLRERCNCGSFTNGKISGKIYIGVEALMNEIVFGNKVRRYRERKNLTQIRCAELADRSERWISDIESGKGNPKLDSLILLSSILDVSIDFLISDKEEPDKEDYISNITVKLLAMDEKDIKNIYRLLNCYEKIKEEFK